MGFPTLLYGLGAARAGSMWLARYLAGHPDCALPANRDLHYFDRIESGTLDRELRRVRDKRARLATQLGGARPAQRAGIAAGIAALDRWATVLARGAEDHAAYRGFLAHGAEGRRLVADITPAYALLRPETLARMQTVAPDTRFVFLLRDPVARCWSHLRMLAGRAGARGAALPAAARAAFDDWAAGGHPEVTARGDYAAILPRLGAAIRPGALLIEFYERLFCDAGMARLCAFLGIAPRPGDYAQRVHEAPPAPLDAGRAARARAILAPQYAAVGAMLGELPAEWTAAGVRGAA
jgi:hypothetical protein